MQPRFSGACAVTGRVYLAGTDIKKAEQGWVIDDTITDEALDAMTTAPVRLRGGSGYGCEGWALGQVCRATWRENHEQVTGVVVILAAGSTFYREDGLSFGVGEDSGYVYWAAARIATDEEAAPVLERESAAQAAVVAERTRQAADNELIARSRECPVVADLPAGWVEKCWITQQGYPHRGTEYTVSIDGYIYPDGTVVVEVYNAGMLETTYRLLTGDTVADLARGAAREVTTPST